MGTRGDLDGTNAKFILYYYNTEGSTNNYQQVLEISPTTINSKNYSLNLKDGALKIDNSNNTILNGTLTMGHYLELKSKVDDTSDVRMEVGTGRVNGNSNASTNAYIDLISDINTGSSDTSDYGLRVIKWKGVSGDAGLYRRGGVPPYDPNLVGPQLPEAAGKLRLVNEIGEVWIESQNNDQRSGVVISTKSTARLYINADGKADFAGNTVTGVKDPAASADATNKSYVDARANKVLSVQRVYIQNKLTVSKINSYLTGLTVSNVMANTAGVMFLRVKRQRDFSTFEIKGTIKGLANNSDWTQWYIVRIKSNSTTPITSGTVSAIVDRGTWNSHYAHFCHFTGYDNLPDDSFYQYQLRLANNAYDFKLNGYGSDRNVLGNTLQSDLIVTELDFNDSLLDTRTAAF